MSEATLQELVLAYARTDAGRGALPPPARQAQAVNRLCGDAVTLYLRADEHGAATLAFESEGCMLCRASAAVAVAEGQGRTPAELAAAAAEVGRVFRTLAPDGSPPPPPAAWSPALKALHDMRRYPSRERCVLLAWEALAELAAAPIKES